MAGWPDHEFYKLYFADDFAIFSNWYFLNANFGCFPTVVSEVFFAMSSTVAVIIVVV